MKKIFLLIFVVLFSAFALSAQPVQAKDKSEKEDNHESEHTKEKSNWKNIFSEIEVKFTTLISDIQTLFTKTNSLETQIADLETRVTFLEENDGTDPVVNPGYLQVFISAQPAPFTSEWIDVSQYTEMTFQASAAIGLNPGEIFSYRIEYSDDLLLINEAQQVACSGTDTCDDVVLPVAGMYYRVVIDEYEAMGDVTVQAYLK